MIFTDEEMRQLKTDIACPYNISHHSISIVKTRLFALLSRLEIADELTKIALRELEGSVFLKDQSKLDQIIRKYRQVSGK